MKGYIKNSLLAGNILLVVLTMGAYLAPYINPDSNFLFPILGLVFPALVVCNLLMILLWLPIRWKNALFSATTLLFGISGCSKLIQVRQSASSRSCETTTVASYNANFTKYLALASAQERPQLEREFSSYLSGLDEIDILCVQEVGRLTSGYISSSMSLPYQHQIENLTVSIYSRWPFTAVGTVDLQSNTANTCLWADVALAPNDTLRVYTVHLESNRADGKVPEVIIEDVAEQVDKSIMLGLLKHYQEFSSKRVDQAWVIRAHAATSPYPYVICGDMNDTPQSHLYQVLSEDLKDSFIEAGLGIEVTYDGGIPGLRLDYIFLEPEIEVIDHALEENIYSDHHMIISQVCLP